MKEKRTRIMATWPEWGHNSLVTLILKLLLKNKRRHASTTGSPGNRSKIVSIWSYGGGESAPYG